MNLDFDPLTIDWFGNQKNIKKDSKLNITSTPIFLIENNGNYNDTEMLDETTSERRPRSSGVNLSLKICNIVLSLLLLF